MGDIWNIISNTVIPGATSVSLLAESSYSPEGLRKKVIMSLKFIFLLLAAAIIGILVFGRYLLLLFGEEYAKNSFELLSILVLGSIPFAVNTLYATVKRIQKEIAPLIWVYGGIAIITLTASYLLMQSTMGLIGVGIACVLANGLVAIAIGLREGMRHNGVV